PTPSLFRPPAPQSRRKNRGVAFFSRRTLGDEATQRVEARHFETAEHTRAAIFLLAVGDSKAVRNTKRWWQPRARHSPHAGLLRLPFDPACLEPHKIARAVLTPGASQVRQPLHSGSERT